MVTDNSSIASSQWQAAFLRQHDLPAEYLDAAALWFDPLAEALATRQKGASRPIIVGVNGCQGSGKSTLCDYLTSSLVNNHERSAIALSLDDFYLTKKERQTLADTVHPLLRTRGVPGTHDYSLLNATLRSLTHGNAESSLAVPRFSKATDDRLPTPQLEQVICPVDVVILEGWCLGGTAQNDGALEEPVNALEQEEDESGIWRKYSNSILQKEFHTLYSTIDEWIMLAAPSFETVLDWRKEQEQKLASKTDTSRNAQHGNAIMNDEEIARFIHHFERLTRHCLKTLPAKVNHFHQLDAQRNVTEYRYQPAAKVVP